MLWIPSTSYREIQHNLLATPGANMGTSVASSATIHTKGSWVPLIATTNFETEWVTVVLAGSSASTTATDLLLDLGIGASTAEQVLVPDLLGGYCANTANMPRIMSFPMYIPKGSRITGRAQSLTASRSVHVTLFLAGGAKQPTTPTYSRCDAIGITSSGASRGTSITSGNTGAEGSWTNVGSAIARDYKALLFLAQGTLSVHTALFYHFEVGFSSTAIAEFHVGTDTSERVNGPIPPMPIFHSIPSGTQLQVRGECSGTAEVLSVALYGLY